MHMLLQKTVLNINVATIDVRFDKGTQGGSPQLARGKPYSPDLAHQLALAAMDAKHAVVADEVHARHPAQPLDRRREGQPGAGAQGAA